MGHIYHYTTGFGLACSIFEGRLRAFSGALDEAAALWFTTAENYDPTSRQGVEELLKENWGHWRFVANQAAAPASFAHFRERHPNVADRLAAEGRARGADPDHWRARYDDLPYAEWLALQRESEQGWIGVSWQHAVKVCCELRGAPYWMPGQFTNDSAGG